MNMKYCKASKPPRSKLPPLVTKYTIEVRGVLSGIRVCVPSDK